MRTILVILLFSAAAAVSQERPVRGKVTYVAGDVVYVSLGRDSGVRDSSNLFVVDGADTIAKLRVFGFSSKSSACRVLSSSRPVRTDDDVTGMLSLPISPAVSLQASGADSLRTGATRDSIAAITSSPGAQPVPKVAGAASPLPPVTVQGRVSAQYVSYTHAGGSADLKQPGLVVDLRGKMNNAPIRFQIYGNFRSSSSGSAGLFSPESRNLSRIYRLSVDYDDGENGISLGRIIPPSAPAAGYVDGALLSRRFGGATFGAGAGFEPDFSGHSFSTDMKKFLLFGAFTADEGIRYTANLGYSKRYVHSTLDREVASGSLNLYPSNDIFIIAQSEVDLRSKEEQSYLLRPKLSFLIGMVNYRAAPFLSVGAGINSWRPAYAFSAISGIEDSLLDQQVRTSPSVTATLTLPAGLSVTDTYSPRSSPDGFGKEYLSSGWISLSNAFHQGITLRGSMNISATTISTTRGYGANLQKMFGELAQVNLRYQWYSYSIVGSDEINRTKSLALDLLAFLTRSFTLWGSFERTTETSTDGNTLFAELSWRF